MQSLSQFGMDEIPLIYMNGVEPAYSDLGTTGEQAQH